MEKLKWKVKHSTRLEDEIDCIDSILQSCGVSDIELFLEPKKTSVLDPFSLLNMQKGIELIHNALVQQQHILMKVDCDCDGYTSAAFLTQFLQFLNPEIQITHRFDFNKQHGLIYEDVCDLEEPIDLIIIPDASVQYEELQKIRKKYKNIPVLIIDHHLIDNDNQKIIEETCIINCMLGDYKNKTLSGVGMVQKVCEGYCEAYCDLQTKTELTNCFLDLVGVGMVGDSMDVRNPETRYYVVQGFKPENIHNNFIKELMIKESDSFFQGELTIHNVGWTVAPLINGVIRYGRPEEQVDLFRAICGVKDDREYQPRRKHATDPKPPIEIHSLQKTMARVCGNVKSRQDTDVRNFVKKIEKRIIEQQLNDNSIIVLDATDILPTGTVNGLIANKIAFKYQRPALLLRAENDEYFGGSGRNYGQGSVTDLKSLLESFNLFEHLGGHADAFGLRINKELIPKLIEQANQAIPLDSLTTVHEVDYEIAADKLTNKQVKQIAEAYAIWGNTVPEPTFVITDLVIPAKEIIGSGPNNNFVHFVYKGVNFIKKYCKKDDYYNMTLRDSFMFGANTKVLRLNIIGSFVFTEFDEQVYPQVRIIDFDVEEYQTQAIDSAKTNNIEKESTSDDLDDWVF